MKIENIRVFGFEPAFRGMRNPKNSWHKSDSDFYKPSICFQYAVHADVVMPEYPCIGSEDMQLARSLIMGGTEERKFLRQIMVWFDITIPRYVWQELDTYKVATVRMSCGTMYDLGNRDLDQSDFQHPVYVLTLEHINELGRLLREAKEEHEGIRQARQMLKNELPEGFLQKATYTLNYETALNIILQRENHRLPEWRLTDEGSITETLMTKLPYMKQFYEAATWKRGQRREVILKLTALATSLKETDPKNGPVNVEAIQRVVAEIRDQLKLAV
jgi:hypothetical protein